TLSAVTSTRPKAGSIPPTGWRFTSEVATVPDVMVSAPSCCATTTARSQRCRDCVPSPRIATRSSVTVPGGAHVPRRGSTTTPAGPAVDGRGPRIQVLGAPALTRRVVADHDVGGEPIGGQIHDVLFGRGDEHLVDRGLGPELLALGHAVLGDA